MPLTRFLVAFLLMAFASANHAEPPGHKTEGVAANKKCDPPQRRIAKEQSSLEAFDDTLAKDKKGRESSSTKPMCARYDEALKSMEARKAEHEQRLAKFKSDAEEACKSS